MRKINIPPLIASVLAICILIAQRTPAPPEPRCDSWYEENGSRYYEYADGTRPSGWITLEGQRYYFLNDGIPATGWLDLEEQRYFLRADGSLATGWMKLAGMNYYFHEDGSLATGWCKLDGRQYYLGDHGAAAIGPTKIDGEHYLFREDGALADGIFLYEGHHYQADAKGHPLAGWASDGTTSFCFDENGQALTGWQTIDGLRYYFYSDGTPAAGIMEVDGITRHFSSFGLYIPLVNPWNQIPEDYTVELTQINANHSVSSIAYDDYMEMITALHADGLSAAVCSSFRTHEYQQRLFDRKMYYYAAIGYEKAEAIVLAGQSVAVPGTSEHQLGLALDIVDTSNWNLDESQAETPAQKWLIEHSWEYGWILRYPDGKSEITGIIYEPWHYRYVGRQVAAEIHELGVCMEEYLEMLTVG